jgi:hypothetical protein
MAQQMAERLRRKGSWRIENPHGTVVTQTSTTRFAPSAALAASPSPSFNWKRHLSDATIAVFQDELSAMGYRFQFITLAGFHALK